MERIFLIDDDLAVRTALARVLREDGWEVEAFESAETFLARANAATRGCIVLDVTLPGLDGLGLQRRLVESGQSMPIIFLSGYGDIPMSVRAIRAGAVDFLTKPVVSRTLLAAVRAAVNQDKTSCQRRQEIEEFGRRFARLTSRERQVLVGVAAGRLNKQIAGDLGVVEQTVKFHRARIMERMEAKTTAELINIAARLGVEAATHEGD